MCRTCKDMAKWFQPAVVPQHRWPLQGLIKEDTEDFSGESYQCVPLPLPMGASDQEKGLEQNYLGGHSLWLWSWGYSKPGEEPPVLKEL